MQERGTFGNELDETASQPASPPTSQPARFSLDECCVGLKPDKMGANILEPTNIVIARCSLFHFLYVTVCLYGSQGLSLYLHLSLYNLRRR